MDSSSMLRSSTPSAAMSSWAQNSVLPVNASHLMKGLFLNQLILLFLMLNNLIIFKVFLSLLTMLLTYMLSRVNCQPLH